METYKFGDKEYTKEEVVEYGREHYPNFYWLKIMIGSVLLLTAFGLLGKSILLSIEGGQKLNHEAIALYLAFGLIALGCGIGCVIASRTKLTEYQCFVHGKKCLAKKAILDSINQCK